MEKTEKLVHQLFIGKVAEIIGIEKTTELLKESKDAFEKPLTEPMKSIEEEANELFPLVDTLPRETGYHENDVSEKQQEAFIKGYELANSQTTNHLKKLIEEVKENVIEIQHSIDAKSGRKAIDQVLKDYLTNNELN